MSPRLIAVAWLLVFGAPSVGVGQEPVSDLRRALELSAEGEHREAVATLRSARSREPSDRIDLHLALELAALGQTSEAHALLQRLAEAPDVHPLVAAEAREQLARITLWLGVVHVRIDGAPRRALLYVDGQRPGSVVRRATTLRLLAGDHELSIRGASGDEIVSERVRVEGTGAQEVVLRLAPQLTASQLDMGESGPRRRGRGPLAPAPAALPDEDAGDNLVLALAIGGGVMAALLVVVLGVALSVALAPTPTSGDALPIFIGG